MMRTHPITRAMLLLGIVAMPIAVLGGLARLGWGGLPLPAGGIAYHGPLMISGVLGTLISMERAIALDQRWTLAAPGAFALGAAALVGGLPRPIGAALFVVGGLVLVAINVAIIRRQAAAFTVTMGVGALMWLIGNILWLGGWPVLPIVMWWGVALVLTIAGERLDLSRARRLPALAWRVFVANVLLLCAGPALALINLRGGIWCVSIGLLALALWLIRCDIVIRTVRRPGLPRYIALCLLAGYVWMGLSGLLALGLGSIPAGPAYDAFLHSLFLGFVMSMIFGHAPIIAPLLLARPVSFRVTLYLPLVALHASVLARIGSDFIGWTAGRQWGGMFNAISLLLFAIVLASSLSARQPAPVKTAAPSAIAR